MPKHLLYRRITVPIFDTRVRLIVTYNVRKARAAFDHLFGPWKNAVDHCKGLCSFADDRAEGALFFHPAGLDFDTVSHDIFHLTHQILAYRGIKFDIHDHEMHALLNGWLASQIIPKLNKYRPLK